uniref:Cytochrome p450 3042A1 n=2 Tax=Brachionus TaxID=10194 RepID=W8SGR1_9BILA|nr:cytochrome p450 3042A1 [Brachionus koreanus]
MFLLFTALSLISFYYLFKKPRESSNMSVPSGPQGLPILGNILQLGDRPHEKMFEWSNKYGPIYKVYLGSELVVVLNGTDTVREALIQNEEEFAGRPKLYMIHATLKGKGLISSPYNSDFNEHKKFLQTSLNKFGRRRSSLEVNCLQTIRETLDEFRERIDNNFEYTNSQMRNNISRIASQNVLTMTFGTRMHDKKLFSHLMDLITENFENTAVAAAFNFLPVTRIFKTFILRNVLRCSEFLNNLISEKLEEYHEDMDEFDLPSEKYESNIIECYLKELLNNVCLYDKTVVESLYATDRTASYNCLSRRLTEKRRSSLSIELVNSMNKFRRKSRYTSFSFDHLSSIVQDLFIAGTETISTSLNWAIIYAAKYSEYQDKLINEIDGVLGKEKLPTESDRSKLNFVQAFLNETMRIVSAGPILVPRSTTKDIVFRGFKIPENTFIMANIWSCMRDPHYWSEPNEFRPERFLDKYGNFVCKNPAMVPFGIGKRACIGESIARLQMFLIFTSLLQKFHFSFAKSEELNDEKLMKGIPGVGLSPPHISLKLRLR